MKSVFWRNDSIDSIALFSVAVCMCVYDMKHTHIQIFSSYEHEIQSDADGGGGDFVEFNINNNNNNQNQSNGAEHWTQAWISIKQVVYCVLSTSFFTLFLLLVSNKKIKSEKK